MQADSDEQRDVRERVLTRYFPAWRAAKPSTLADPDWSFLTPGIAHWFRAAIDEGVVEVTCAGEPALPDARHTWFFERNIGVAKLYREGFLEVAAAGLLALRFGWPAERLTFQSPMRRGRALWAFDLVAYTDTHRTDVAIAGEAKWRQSDAEGLVTALEACGLRGEHAEDDCPKLNAHRKYVGLLELRPQLVWIIGPEAFSENPDLLFRVEVQSGGVVRLDHAEPAELAASLGR